MAIPKSAKLRREEESQKGSISVMPPAPASAQSSGPLRIKPIKCCNEFVALVQASITSTVELPKEATMLNEGIVVGTGPGIPNNGDRTPSQVALGDRVMFAGAPVATINSDSGFWEGQRIIVISERNLLCVLPKSRDFEIVDGAAK